MNNIDVSIIICTYNSVIKKIERTSMSAMEQNVISTEIVLSDDCSREKNLKQVEDILKKNNYSNYSIIENSKNLGISKNAKKAVERAQGKYVYVKIIK